MKYQNNMKRAAGVFLFLCLACLNQPSQAHASGSLTVGKSHHGREYAQVMVSGNRYYYDQGIYYTGAPGHYVVVDAPVGAVIYDMPRGYESVVIEGAPYYRYNNVYYRRGYRGYEVVRAPAYHDRGEHHGAGQDHRRDHR